MKIITSNLLNRFWQKGIKPIKDSVTQINSNLAYKTSETICGTWNGATIYRKIIKCSALPNSSNLQVPHGIDNQYLIVKIYGMANDPARMVTIPLPYAAATPTVLYVDGINVTINTKNDMSNYTRVYVIVEYTKILD